MTISTTATFCAGHRLLKYTGACANVHGHNYRIVVRVTGPTDEMGFVTDFKVLKNCVRRTIEVFDHAFIANWIDDLVEWLGLNHQKYVLLNCNPTAENIAQAIYNVLQVPGLLSVRLWETENNWAEVATTNDAVQIKEVYPCSTK